MWIAETAIEKAKPFNENPNARKYLKQFVAFAKHNRDKLDGMFDKWQAPIREQRAADKRASIPTASRELDEPEYK